MGIQRHIFDVEYDFPSGAREFRTRVIMRDKVDVEVEGHRYGVMDQRQQPSLVGLLWLWYSSRREGHVPAETSFEDFRNRCLDNALVEDAPVPPTTEGAFGGSPSLSLSASPEPASTTGSMPPATTTA